MLKTIEPNIKKLYGDDPADIQYQYARYEELYKLYRDTFSTSKELHIISTPGRTEISGNHTDHNGGKVIAASIDLDTLIAYSKENNHIKLKSDKYPETFSVDIDDLAAKENEKGTTAALIRGIISGFKNYGYKIGGFCGVLTSDVIEGSGLSSSASVEVAIGAVLNQLYNDNKIPPNIIAEIGRFAENEYFGKPCGLMDQMACAVGGIIGIDFKDDSSPKIEKIDFDLSGSGYQILVTNTGSTHVNLTEHYAAIPNEMKSVAKFFSKEKIVELTYDQILENIIDLREKIPDRAILRTIHFLSENRRVELQINALKENKLNEFLRLVNESGNSSYKYLQNIYANTSVEEQSLSIALAVSENFIGKLTNFIFPPTGCSTSWTE
jgi:galactokinase